VPGAVSTRPTRALRRTSASAASYWASQAATSAAVGGRRMASPANRLMNDSTQARSGVAEVAHAPTIAVRFAGWSTIVSAASAASSTRPDTSASLCSGSRLPISEGSGGRLSNAAATAFHTASPSTARNVLRSSALDRRR